MPELPVLVLTPGIQAAVVAHGRAVGAAARDQHDALIRECLDLDEPFERFGAKAGAVTKLAVQVAPAGPDLTPLAEDEGVSPAAGHLQRPRRERPRDLVRERAVFVIAHPELPVGVGAPGEQLPVRRARDRVVVATADRSHPQRSMPTPTNHKATPPQLRGRDEHRYLGLQHRTPFEGARGEQVRHGHGRRRRRVGHSLKTTGLAAAAYAAAEAANAAAEAEAASAASAASADAGAQAIAASTSAC